MNHILVKCEMIKHFHSPSRYQQKAVLEQTPCPMIHLTFASMVGTSFFMVSSRFQLSLRWSRLRGWTLRRAVEVSKSSCRPRSSSMAFCSAHQRVNWHGGKMGLGLLVYGKCPRCFVVLPYLCCGRHPLQYHVEGSPPTLRQ